MSDLLKESIVRVVCHVYGVSETDMQKHTKLTKAAEAKQMIQYLFRRYAEIPIIQVAAMYKCHHSTISIADNKVKDKILKRARTYNRLKEALKLLKVNPVKAAKLLREEVELTNKVPI